MATRTHNLAPSDLGVAAPPDPFAIQPGAIVLDRFCVIGRVRHGAIGWRVAATDLRRELGAAPHHRLDLHFLPLDPASERVVRSGLPAHQAGSRRVHAVVSVDGGLVLATQAAEGAHLQLPVAETDALGVARALAGILAGLHQSGVVGARFDLQDVRIDPLGRCQLASWHHLRTLRLHGRSETDKRLDLDALVALLAALGPALQGVLDPHPTSADALVERLARIGRVVRPLSPAEVLPAIPPFLGRRAELLAIHEGVARSRHTGPELLCVTGSPGHGRSRLLQQLSLELTRGDGFVCLHLTHRRDDPQTRGLSRIMAALASAIQAFPSREREQVAARMLRAVGPLAGLVQSLDQRLGSLVGHGPPLPSLPLDERFVRHAATATDVLAAVGTPERPLVLLVDDVHRSDASTRALLYHLLVPGRACHVTVVCSSPEREPPDLPRAAHVLELQPWTADELQELVLACLPGRVAAPEEIAQQLFEASGGQPGRAWGALQSAVNEGRVVRDEEARAWRLGESAHRGRLLHLAPAWRWSALSSDARSLGALLAVRPEPAEPEFLRRVTRWGAQQLRPAAEELIQAGLLIQEPSGRLRWPADGVRDRVLEEAGDRAIADAHSAVARWLRSLGQQATAAQRAWHEEHGGDDIDRVALARLHVDAGHELLHAYDAERAQWHFDRALASATASDPELRRAGLEGRADALLLQGRTDDALQAYLGALDLASDPAAGLAVVNRALHGMWLKGAVEATVVLADRGLQAVGQRLPRTMLEAIGQALWAGVNALVGHAGQPDEVADELCLLHTEVVAGVASSHPPIVVSGIFRGLQFAGRRPTGASARARAFFSVLQGALGLVPAMRRLLDRAEADTVAAGDPNARGVVLHMRGQGLMAAGFYDEGQEAMGRALQAFRAAGDLSIGVSTLSVAALYALNREPADRLIARLQEAENAAYRQRNASVLPGLWGLRALVRARCGEVFDLQIEADEGSSEQGELVASVVGDASLAMALLHLGRVRDAGRVAQRALARLDAAQIAPPFLEIALVAAARAAVAEATPGAIDRSVLKVVRRLRQQARTSRSLQVASDVVQARLEILLGQVDRARSRLSDVVERAPAHAEAWHVLEAHEILAEIAAGRDAPAARAHEELATVLRGRLWPSKPAPEPAAPRLAEPASAEGAPLDGLFEDLPATVAPLLGRHSLKVHAAVGLVTTVAPELAELLLVNLVLAARDMTPTDGGGIRLVASPVELGSEEAARYPDAKPGPWIRIAVQVTGQHGPTSRGALAECSDLARRAGGFFDHTPAGSLDAWLPSSMQAIAPAERRVVAIVHSDERVQRTLVQGARQLGWSAQVVPIGELDLDEVDLALVEESQSGHVASGGNVARVVRRGSRGRSGLTLPVPFLVQELEALLATAPDRVGRAPTGAGPRSG